MKDLLSHIDHADPETSVLYLEVPSSKVVLFQAVFETYEGIGVVRTLDLHRSLVCILSTPSMVEECLAVLESIREEIPWTFAERPSEEDRMKYLGYFGKPT